MGPTEVSVLQVCQLTELNETKKWERYPNRFRRLYETLLPESLGKHCPASPAGKTESQIKLPIQKTANSKPQDVTVYTDSSVTKERSRRGFTFKQGATTIHEVQCCLYGLNLQLANGDGSSHPCPPLDCNNKLQSDHTCHHPHAFRELATKK